jgi:polysaccharide chain length determinant protein (PEP-CTERM system associated)
MNEILGTLYGYLRAVWARRWVAVGTAWGVALVAWVVVLMIPDRYEASARVFVDSRTALRPVLEGIAIQSDYESQLALVREALLSRPQLEAVAKQTHLDDGITDPAARDVLITVLQKQIQVTSAAPASPDGQGQDAVFTISYRHEDRAKSVEVVQKLLDNFVNGTLSGNRAGSSEAQSFLNTQIGELDVRLQAAEARLADFKKRNLGMIPGEGGDYFTRMNQEMTGLQKAETDLAVALSRRSELQRQLSQARVYLPGASQPASGTALAGGSADITVRRQEAEQKLEELQLRFTDRHPEVVALKQTVQELKQREGKELADLQRGGTGSGEIRSLSVNPVYQEIQSQLNLVQVEIASHQGAAEQHRREIANLRRFVDQAPEIEQEFARLNRDYDVTKAQYEQLVARREQAKVTDDASRAGIVRFDEIEPPRASLEPVSPKRALLFIAVLMLAVGAGIGVALLPTLLKPAFGDVSAVSKDLRVPVLGAISEVQTPDDRLQDKLQLRKVALASVALLVVAGVLLAVGRAGASWLQALIA